MYKQNQKEVTMSVVRTVYISQKTYDLYNLDAKRQYTVKELDVDNPDISNKLGVILDDETQFLIGSDHGINIGDVVQFVKVTSGQ